MKSIHVKHLKEGDRLGPFETPADKIGQIQILHKAGYSMFQGNPVTSVDLDAPWEYIKIMSHKRVWFEVWGSNDVPNPNGNRYSKLLPTLTKISKTKELPNGKDN